MFCECFSRIRLTIALRKRDQSAYTNYHVWRRNFSLKSKWLMSDRYRFVPLRQRTICYAKAKHLQKETQAFVVLKIYI